ncbi:MAG: hypothetical protein ACXAB7_02760 [Candidatus Kariarchaeaceae archaeon]
MVSPKPSKRKKSQTVTLDDIIDLSVIELYILNLLVRLGSNAVRFSVFNEVNAQLSSSKISRSSFYNSLQKLEKKGFVIVLDNPKGKGSTVQATQLAREAIKQSNIFSIWGSIDLQQITVQISEQLTEQFRDIPITKQILVSCDELASIETLNILEQSAKQTYILSDDKLYETYQNRGLELPQTRFEEGIIREPDNFFDRGIISKYHGSIELFDITASELLKEVVRVVKPGGYIVLTSFDEFPKTDNLILDSVMSDLLTQAYFTPSTRESLKKDMENAGINDVKSHGYRGYIVTIGEIP